MNTLHHILGISLLAILLPACSGPSTKPDLSARPQRESLAHFVLDGRMLISQPGHSNTLRINWEHSQETDLIGFSGPLGNQLAQLQRDAQGARWISADGEHQEAGDADQLLARLTETPVPLASLALWVLGRVSPQAQNLERDPLGRLVSASDENWTVRITRYESDLPNALPALLEVEGAGLRVKLAIETWQP